ncbi:MAG: CHAT domain-containing protein [Acidobacteria bacterium]|nr:CHAT domain-containing protein [Acidobacteriota bacterium]
MRTSKEDPIRILAYAPQCTDAAVAMLEVLARPKRDARTWSDLAGAYYIRAQRKDQPEDLVRSLDASERARQYGSRKPEERFNRALALETLGLVEDALEEWDSLRHDLPEQWKEEAAEHWNRLSRAQTLSAASQWPLHEKLLSETPDADRAAVEDLVRGYEGPALRYVEETVLLAWAEARDEKEAAKQLRLARRIAEAIATLSGDRYLLESVEQIRTARSADLRNGCRSLHTARLAEQSQDSKGAIAAYQAAEEAFARAASPLRFTATLYWATNRVFAPDIAGALEMFRRLEPELRQRRYSYLLSRLHSNRGFCYTAGSRLLDALAEYDKARAILDKTNDQDGLANLYTRKLGVLRKIGHMPSIWRALLLAQGRAAATLAPQSRHLLLGESSLSALELGYPRVGLLYQEQAVRLISDLLNRNTDKPREKYLNANLGVALRGRAGMFASLNRYAAAKADLDRALPLIAEKADPANEAIRSGFRARFAEVQAQTLALTDRKKAIEALNEAIHLASTTHYQSLVASLLLRRGELYQAENDKARGLADLRSAITALHKEQKLVLGGRPTISGQDEAFWSAYFSRSQEAYRRVVRQLVADGKPDEAFDYAEEAHAAEPLDLVLQRNEWMRRGKPLTLSEVQRELPAHTTLLQYMVLDDRAYVWVVRNAGRPECVPLSVGNDKIAEWTNALHEFANARDAENFEALLAAPYFELFAAPMAKVAADERVVIVPDRAMHGLPFPALRDGQDYFIRRHSLSIAASATLYAFSLARDRQEPSTGRESVLLFVNPAFNPKLDVARGLQPLRGAEEEANRIERLYAPDIIVRRRSGVEATIPEFLELARGSAVMHVIAHGVANPDMPSRSFFLFAPAEADSGALDATRLLSDLRLEHPRLAVLSACSSAGGTPVGPEGLAPLVRPIIAAGVPGVIGTLWNVSDNSATAELLVKFHRHYRDGDNADDALRKAQIEMIEDPELERRSAIAWAPFQLVGYASSPFAARAHPKRR